MENQLDNYEIAAIPAQPDPQQIQSSQQPSGTADCYTPIELSKKLKLPLKTIRKYSGQKRVPGQFKVGKQWRYRSAEVDKQFALKNQFFMDHKPSPLTQLGRLKFSQPISKPLTKNGVKK